MGKQVQPRGHKALREAIENDSPALQRFARTKHGKRMLAMHASDTRPSLKAAHAYERALGIPVSAWLTRDELREHGCTLRDVDEDFEFLRARRAAATMGVYVEAAPAEGVPTKPTKPVAAEEPPVETLYPVGSVQLIRLGAPNGATITVPATVKEARGDMRLLSRQNADGTTSTMALSCAALGLMRTANATVEVTQ